MSKELEALKELYKYARIDDFNDVRETSIIYCIIKSALERKDQLETENSELKARNEKLEKFVKIVKTKKPALKLLDELEVDIEGSYTDYCIDIENEFLYADERLTETEFNLLKEMLK